MGREGLESKSLSQVGVAHEKERGVVVFEDGSAEFFGRKNLHPEAACEKNN